MYQAVIARDEAAEATTFTGEPTLAVLVEGLETVTVTPEVELVSEVVLLTLSLRVAVE
jgi:hypothetical protein